MSVDSCISTSVSDKQLKGPSQPHNGTSSCSSKTGSVTSTSAPSSPSMIDDQEHDHNRLGSELSGRNNVSAGKDSDRAEYSVPVLIRTNNGQSFEFSFMSSDTIAAVLATVLDQPRFVHYTCSHLTHNNIRLLEYTNIASIPNEPKDSKLTFELVQHPYGERDLRAHVLRVREILSLNNPMRSNLSPAGDVDSGMTILRQVTGERYLDPNFDKYVAKHAEKHDYHVETVYDDDVGSTCDHACTYMNDMISQKFNKTRKLTNEFISLGVSGWNPVPAWRRSRGDLIYLSVCFNSTSNEIFHITGTRHGFFANKSTNSVFDPSSKSKVFHSFAKLCASLSPSFSKFFGKLIDGLHRDNVPVFAAERSLLQSVTHKLNWCVVMECTGTDRAPHALGTGHMDHTYDCLRQLGGTCVGGDTVLETGALDQIRSWNDELQMLMAHALHDHVEPKSGDSTAQQEELADGLNPMLRIRQYNLSYNQFVQLVIQGARGISDGAILPLPLPVPDLPEDHTCQPATKLYESAPPSDSIFIWNGIFFSFAEANQPRFAKEGHNDPIAAAHAYTGKDIVGLRHVLTAGIHGLSTIPTVVIDIHGRRLCAQAMPPGILDSPTGPKIIYGSQEEPIDPADRVSVPYRRGINSDSEFHQLVGKLADKLFLAEHGVIDEKTGDKHTLWTSPDTRGISALDGRKYLVELPRISPVDSQFLESADKDGLATYPHRMAFVRPEYIKLYNHRIRDKYVTNLQREAFDKQVAGGTDPADVCVDLDMLEVKDDIPYVRINVDIGTSWATDQMDVSDLQAKLMDSLYSEEIPQFVQQYVSQLEPIPITSDVLTQNMHTYGLSMHHLKAIVGEVDQFLANPNKLTEDMEVISTENDVHEAESNPGQVANGKEETLVDQKDKNAVDSGAVKDNTDVQKAAKKCIIDALQATHRVRLVAIRAVLEREMILRAFKHIGRKYFAMSKPDEITVTASTLLNLILNVTEFPESQPEIEMPDDLSKLTSNILGVALVREIQMRFRHTITGGTAMTSITHKQALLRESCLKLGIQLVMRPYGPEYCIQEHDVVTVVPKIKAAYLESDIVLEHVAVAEKFMASHTMIGNAANALEMALHLSEQAHTSLHPLTIRIQSLLASTYRRLVTETSMPEAEGQFALGRALDLMRTTTVCRERVFGLDASDVCESYLELANLEALAGRFRLALKYIHHATQLWVSVQGNVDFNPDFVSVTNLICKFLARINRFDLACQFQEKMVSHNTQSCGEQGPTTITSKNSLSQYLFMAARAAQAAHMRAFEKKMKTGNKIQKGGQFHLDTDAYQQVERAVQLQQEVHHFWSTILVPEDLRLQESSALLNHYKEYKSDLDKACEQHKLAVQQGVLKKIRDKEDRKGLATKGNCPIEDILAYVNGEKKTLVPTAKPSPARLSKALKKQQATSKNHQSVSK